MRLLLDAQLSPKRIGGPLRQAGHDVVALAEEAWATKLGDGEVLELAASESRILVTANAKDFAPLLRRWGEEGRTHAGCVLIWTMPNHAFGPIVRALARWLQERSEPDDWRNLPVDV